MALPWGGFLCSGEEGRMVTATKTKATRTIETALYRVEDVFGRFLGFEWFLSLDDEPKTIYASCAARPPFPNSSEAISDLLEFMETVLKTQTTK